MTKNVADLIGVRTPAYSSKRGLSGLRPLTQVTSRQLRHRCISHCDMTRLQYCRIELSRPRKTQASPDPSSGAFSLSGRLHLCVFSRPRKASQVGGTPDQNSEQARGVKVDGTDGLWVRQPGVFIERRL